MEKKLLSPKEFSRVLTEEIKNQKLFGLDRSVFKLLNIAKTDDYEEMIWQMYRLLAVLDSKNEEIYSTLNDIQDNPEEIKKYFYSMIISIMLAASQGVKNG
jgi:FPC/CPF motif-containing protein YcgG